MQLKILRRPLWAAPILFLGSLLLASSSTLSSSSSPSPPSTNPSHPHQHQQSYLEVYENEYHNAETSLWTANTTPDASMPPRWTASSSSDRDTHQRSPPPDQITAPTGWQFTSGWKIDIGGSRRDELGWEYYTVTGHADVGNRRRRRRWLRPIVLVSSVQLKPPPLPPLSSTTKLKTSNNKASLKKHRTKPFLLQSLKDNYNYKGHGYTLIKPLLHAQACGLTFSIPLSPNFDSYERRPYLPTLTSTAGVYYPWMGAVFLNFSLPMQLLKCWFWTLLDWGAWISHVSLVLFRIALVGLWRYGIAWPLNMFCYLVSFGQVSNFPSSSHKKKKVVEENTSSVTVWGYALPFHPPKRTTIYQTMISERLGVSMSWRFSERKGYEFCISAWHLYMPTLEYLSDISTLISNKILGERPSTKKSSKDNNSNNNNNNNSKAVEKTRRRHKKVSSSSIDNNGNESTDHHKTTHDMTTDGEEEVMSDCDSEPLTLPAPSSSRGGAIIQSWIRRHTGSLGVNVGGPTSNPPFCTASLMLSLSGFYGYGSKTLKKVVGTALFSRRRRVGSVANSVDKWWYNRMILHNVSRDSSNDDDKSQRSETVSSLLKSSSMDVVSKEGEVDSHEQSPSDGTTSNEFDSDERSHKEVPTDGKKVERGSNQ